MSRPAAPLAAAVHAHGDGHAHGHAHSHAHHDHAHDAPQEAPPALPASLLMAGAGSRLLGTLGVLLLLWLAVAWALGDPA
jgi:hypothetical protein